MGWVEDRICTEATDVIGCGDLNKCNLNDGGGEGEHDKVRPKMVRADKFQKSEQCIQSMQRLC